MYYPQINYSQNAQASAFTFYLPANGVNAGQPATAHLESSISIQCTTQEWFDFYFWLTNSLYLTGQLNSGGESNLESMLSLEEVQKLLYGMAESMYPHWEQYQLVVAYLKSIKAARVALSDYIITAEKQQEFFRGFQL